MNGRTGGNAKTKSKFITPTDVPVDVSMFLQKNTQENLKNNEEINMGLQNLLQFEPEEINEQSIKEIDSQIHSKFNECIDVFVEISAADRKQENFMKSVEYKMVSRLQQKPLECIFSGESKKHKPEVNEKLAGYSSIITTYQIHACYMIKLFSLPIKEEKKIEYLNLLYSDMEKDPRLILTGIYLARLLLTKILENQNIEFKTFLEHPESEIYRTLVYKIINASQDDSEKLRKLAKTLLTNMEQVVNDDIYGIDPDPMHLVMKQNIVNVSNKITAYQKNRNLIDKRMAKLKSLMISFVKTLREFLRNENFSEIITLIVKDFIDACTNRFKFNLQKYDPQTEVVQDTAHIILEIVFKLLCKALETPSLYYILPENEQGCSAENLKSLSKTVYSFFSGKPVGEKNERWLNEINQFNTEDQENISMKVNILTKILELNPDLEQLYLESLFLQSLEPCDKLITVSGQSLMNLHKLTANNLESLRVNNPSYDPLNLLCKALDPVLPVKTFTKYESINLSLFTRSLRYDQSIVRCPNCMMIVPRDMAPSSFKPVIELFDPVPPNNPSSLLAKILGSGCKKGKRQKFIDYLNQFENIYKNYLKDFTSVEKVTLLKSCVDTLYSANFDESVEPEDEAEKEAYNALIEKNKEKFFKFFEKEGLENYEKKRKHSFLQKKLMKNFKHLLSVLKKHQEKSIMSVEHQKNLIFNIEYGACNRELELFSDSVMFSIYMNKIREYTQKKDMSISLYENLTDQMKESLRGFMKRSMKELLSKKILKEYAIPPYANLKDIILSFENDQNFFLIIVTYAKSKFNFCGRDEFNQEELLLYEKISSEKIMSMREDLKSSSEDLL